MQCPSEHLVPYVQCVVGVAALLINKLKLKLFCKSHFFGCFWQLMYEHF